MTLHQKVNVLIFFNISPRRAILKKNSGLSILLSCLVLSSSIFPIKKILLRILLQQYFFATCLFLLEHPFCLSHRKIRWTMSMDNIGFKIRLLGSSNSMVTLTFFPWHKLKWSQDEFNNQSHIL